MALSHFRTRRMLHRLRCVDQEVWIRSSIPALIDCPACGTKTSNKADSCPHCAHPIAPLGCISEKAGLRFIEIVVAIGILVGVLAWLSHEREKDRKASSCQQGATCENTPMLAAALAALAFVSMRGR